MPHRLRPRRFLAALAMAVSVTIAPLPSGAQTPASAPAVSVVAHGLANPRGMAFDTDGSLIVGLAGSGKEDASVVRIGADGCPAAITAPFPTGGAVFGTHTGFADVSMLGGALYGLMAGGNLAQAGQAHNGLYRLDGTGGAAMVADIAIFVRDHPVAEKPRDYDQNGQPVSLWPLPDGSGFVATEGNSNQLLRLGLDGSVTRIADLSVRHPIATGVVAAPDGGWWVALFTHFPYTEGSAKVIHVAPDGTLADAWTNLSVPIDLALGPDGALYALEMATGYGEDDAKIVPGTGKVLRQTGPASAETVVTGLPLPSAFGFGPDNALLISSPIVGADDGSGVVLKITLPAGPDAAPVDAGTAQTAPTACA